MVRIVAPAGTLAGFAGRWRGQNAKPSRAASVAGHGHPNPAVPTPPRARASSQLAPPARAPLTVRPPVAVPRLVLTVVIRA
ncbi:hypothetical protein Acy02nite_45970 [Actinoplanes cyaneus]|uniref:Uncharacterized protein n=1 Tax=Actinoplanes cyaneus TaxID=52696 RepID=A0A919ILC3_9ACTN|nr:hypothetical protein Acy02nite_45970 [Actinoplanes cyaneus]